MSFKLAIQAFFKALKKPEEAKKFVEGQPQVCQPRVELKKDESKPGSLEMLALLQQKGRLVDFLQEEIVSYPDADIGSCVRKIHEDCRKTLEEAVAIRPVLQEKEGSSYTVPQGYDARAIKVVGNAAGHPPFQGIVRHSGWKATKAGVDGLAVIYPAEIEVR
ncbi:DUF2760 domain-containing protein [Estrella lausannensis]|uniref:DUF2760 domain-containing protein n=1 Tax=Estrella lausannensis TaxID=483423 RepID=A0A0H5DPP4_9BACT|nr:DUF2760 domain-containing protein [Estrella lausannensis]CRX37983.1 Conserved hypothetical protein [Estrella lausannensis]